MPDSRTLSAHDARAVAEALLTELVAIPSLSREEAAASCFLAESMKSFGYERTEVDAAGNAVGEIGPMNARWSVVLLGHIDTVPGAIPVRVEDTAHGPVLYGRGSVDAKGPLATFTVAVARLGHDWAHRNHIRLVVVGAVEEEAATSKGARFIRDRFDGHKEPMPDYCIIGEPSGASRMTLGYKGRLLLEMEAVQPMAHTSGPDPGVATLAVDLWNWTVAYRDSFNRQRPKTFDQFLPSLRELYTWTDEDMLDRVRTKIGIRLPPAFSVDEFLAEVWQWAQERSKGQQEQTLGVLPIPPSVDTTDATPQRFQCGSHELRLHFCTYGHEPAWRSDRNNPLVRSFLGAIRERTADRPRFVVKSGTSDMNVVGPAWQCPIVAYGPGNSRLDHTAHEHIHLDEYWQAVLILESALRRLVEHLLSVPAVTPAG